MALVRNNGGWENFEKFNKRWGSNKRGVEKIVKNDKQGGTFIWHCRVSGLESLSFISFKSLVGTLFGPVDSLASRALINLMTSSASLDCMKKEFLFGFFE